VIDDHPPPITFGVNEAGAGRHALAFAVLDVGKRVVAGIDGSVTEGFCPRGGANIVASVQEHAWPSSPFLVSSDSPC
jgi:hypothetical protein